jgi:hypothetical protein
MHVVIHFMVCLNRGGWQVVVSKRGFRRSQLLEYVARAAHADNVRVKAAAEASLKIHNVHSNVCGDGVSIPEIPIRQAEESICARSASAHHSADGCLDVSARVAGLADIDFSGISSLLRSQTASPCPSQISCGNLGETDDSAFGAHQSADGLDVSALVAGAADIDFSGISSLVRSPTASPCSSHAGSLQMSWTTS